MVRAPSPPCLMIQLRIAGGYCSNSARVNSALVICFPVLSSTQPAWNPSTARPVIHILSFGMIVTSVHAEKQFPSIITRSPESRMVANIRRYLPSGPPISSRMRVTAADDCETAIVRSRPMGTKRDFITQPAGRGFPSDRQVTELVRDHQAAQALHNHDIASNVGVAAQPPIAPSCASCRQPGSS